VLNGTDTDADTFEFCFELPSLEEIEQMQRQRLQAIEAL
jgi:hypothetical protein